jgi:hypothetical protein
MPTPEVALVVPSYKRPEALEAQWNYMREMPFAGRYCVASGTSYCETSHVSGWDFFASYPNQQVLSGPARNVALAAAFAEHSPDAWYLLIDDDTWIDWAAIEQTLAACVEHPTFGLVMPTDCYNGSFADRELRNEAEFSWIDWKVPYRVVLVSGRVVEKIGFHDPRFGWREDVEYSIRAKCAGFRTIAMRVCSAKWRSKLEYMNSGGYEASTASAPEERAAKIHAGSLQIAKIFPWTKVDKRGYLLWARQFEALSEEERAEYATYHGEYRIKRV